MTYESTAKSAPTGYARIRLYDPENDIESEIDSVDGALIGIDLVHHEIHDGCHFTVAVVDTSVDIAGPKYVRITSPNTDTRIHFVAMVSADGASLVEFYENPTINAAGSALTEYNNDRNSVAAATATTFEDTTTTNDGTLLFAFRVGGTGVGQTRTSGELSTRQEWILRQNEDYLVKVTVDGNGTEVVTVLTWYEVSS